MNTAYNEHHKGLALVPPIKYTTDPPVKTWCRPLFLKTWAYLVRGGKIDLMKAFSYHVLNGLIIDEYLRHKPFSLDNMILNGSEPLFDTQERQISILEGKAILLKMIACLKNIRPLSPYDMWRDYQLKKFPNWLIFPKTLSLFRRTEV